MHDPATTASPWRVPTRGEMLAREAFERRCFDAAQKQAEHVRKPLAGFRDVLDAAEKADLEKMFIVLPDPDNLTKKKHRGIPRALEGHGMIDTATMHYAIATATALAGIGAATAWAIQARDADRARRDAERSLARQLAEAERLRRLCRESDAALAATREELRQARLALSAADAELERRDAARARNCDRFATEDEAREAYWAYRDPLEFDDKPFVAITEWLFMPIEGKNGKGGEA